MKKTIMKSMILFILVVIVFFFNTQNVFCATKIIKKEVEVETKDEKLIKAQITYPNTKMKKYPTVLLLHSIGYSSEYWGGLIEELNNAGFLVIAMDLRGHGQSVFNTSFQQRSWCYFSEKEFQKFPSDVKTLLDRAKLVSKPVDMKDYAIVGADIGANSAVLATTMVKEKPKALVLLSPVKKFKGLYIPIAMTELGQIPILTMVSKKDKFSLKEQQDLVRFAQGPYYAQNYSDGGMGMLMIKLNKTMAHDITNWLVKTMR